MKIYRYFIVIATLSLFARIQVQAQATFGTITGVVTDSSGAVVPNVVVKILSQDTGITREIATNESGIYEVTHLNPGRYAVSTQSAGFKKFEHRDVIVEALRTVRINIPLEVGNMEAEITVDARTPLVETEASTISDQKGVQQLRDLPLNILNGVILNSFLFSTPTGYQSAGSKFSLGGARGTQLHYNIDGISANSPAFGVQNSPAEPTLESIQEMRFDIVNNRAEFGEVTNVTAITRSGSNGLHGTLFWYNGINQYNAKPYFATEKGKNINNDLGFTLSGPIIKNKTFFFGSYEAFRQRIPAIQAPNLPTVKMRRGDFSDLLNLSTPIVIRNPYANNTPFPGNIIPPELFNSTSVKWQERFFPPPNYGPPDLTVGNFRGTFPQQVQEDSFDIRVDHYFSAANKIYAKYGYKRLDNHMIDAGVPPEYGGTRVNVREGWVAMISDTWTVSPQFINEFKVGFARGFNPREGSLGGQELIDYLGIQGLPRVSEDVHNIPTVNITGFHTIFQVAKAQPAENTFQLIDQVTFIKGRHTVKAGGEYRPQQFNEYVSPMFGSYGFTNRFSGHAYSDFLLGLPNSTSRTYARDSQAGRTWFLSGFIQDDFKVSQRLTLNYGLRYEFDHPAVDTFDTVANFDLESGSLVVPTEKVRREKVNPLFPSNIPIITAEQAGFPTRSLRDSDKNNFQPRVGFALRPSNNTSTVIRGGYGIFYDDLTLDLFSELWGGPFGVTESFTNNFVGGNPQLTFTTPFLGSGTVAAVNVTGIDRDLANPYVQQWNLTFEREIGFNSGVRLSYIGTKATDLIYGRNINQPLASGLAFSQDRRSYPLYRNITLRDNGGNQIYHGLSTEVERRWARGLAFQVAWTWAKNLADVDENAGRTEGGPTLEDAFDRSRERGDVQFSPRHRFLSNMLWELPFGAGRQFLNQPGPVDWILGGWQLSAIYNYQTGEFLTPTFSGPDPSNTQTFGGVPDRIGNGNLPEDQRSLNRWFDASAFTVPPNGRFGNAGRGIIVGPNRHAMNLGAFKSFKINERASVRFQATFANVLNHPNFGNPNLGISTPTAVGTITSTQSRDSSGAREGLMGIRIDF
jgi:Carboxypeptidase regulatory-like domain